MNAMKKVGALSLAAVLSLGLVACNGEGGNSGEKSAEKIVIYTGGSTEFIWRAGADEEAVRKFLFPSKLARISTSMSRLNVTVR